MVHTYDMGRLQLHTGVVMLCTSLETCDALYKHVLSEGALGPPGVDRLFLRSLQCTECLVVASIHSLSCI